MINYHTSGAQVLNIGPAQELKWNLFEWSRDEALMVYHRLGGLMNPWDDSWKEETARTKKRLYDRQHEIAGTGLTDKGIVKMVKEFEDFKNSQYEDDKPETPNEASKE